MTTTPRSLHHWLSPADSSLGALLAQAELAGSITAKVRACLAQETFLPLVTTRIENQTLVLYTTSPAWATRLRYLGPRLLSQVGTLPTLAAVTRIRICIVPAAEAPPSPPSTRPTLSNDSAALLHRAADTLQDEALAGVFRRLARHAMHRS